MSGPVSRLTEQALDERSYETLLEAFVAAARFGVEGDEASLPLPFEAAERLGIDVDRLVDEAVHHLDEDEEALLRDYAAHRHAA